MNFLALDTSSDACSAALQYQGQTLQRHVVEAKQHTELLMPMIRQLLKEAGAALADLDAVVLGNGPGSFIGLRIAASVAQGLAYGAGLKIVPVSSLAAVAAECMASGTAGNVAVTQDAHMGEVYLGLFAAGAGGVPSALADEILHGRTRIAALQDGAWTAAGAGWQRYPELLEANRERFAHVSDVRVPRATYLLQNAAAAWQAGMAIEPQFLAPAYIRMKVAEKSASAG